MSRDRITPCKFYENEGNCSKGREGTLHGYCQKCDKYIPRVKEKHLNKKKQELEKIRKKEIE